MEHPGDPSRLRIDPVKAEVVKQLFAWYTDPPSPISLRMVAQRLSEQQVPTPAGAVCWHAATVRGILRSPTYVGTAYSGRTRKVASERRQSAMRPVGRGEGRRPAPREQWIGVSVPAIVDQELS